MAPQSKYRPAFARALARPFSLSGSPRKPLRKSAPRNRPTPPPSTTAAARQGEYGSTISISGLPPMRRLNARRRSTAPSPPARPTVRCASATKAMTASKASGSSSAPAKPAGRTRNEARVVSRRASSRRHMKNHTRSGKNPTLLVPTPPQSIPQHPIQRAAFDPRPAPGPQGRIYETSQPIREKSHPQQTPPCTLPPLASHQPVAPATPHPSSRSPRLAAGADGFRWRSGLRRRRRSHHAQRCHQRHCHRSGSGGRRQHDIPVAGEQRHQHLRAANRRHRRHIMGRHAGAGSSALSAHHLGDRSSFLRQHRISRRHGRGTRSPRKQPLR